MMTDLEFANPEYFLLLALIPVALGWRLWKRRSFHLVVKNSGTLHSKLESPINLHQMLEYMPYIALIPIIIALARPQKSFSENKVKTEGIDIVLSMDVSTSMLAQDLRPNRLKAAKEVAKSFVKQRNNDRIGMVVFAGESFTQCPITTDHKILIEQIEKVKDGVIKDGTAIGMGLGTAINRLKESQAKSKVVILMTDGVNNTGYIDPITAIDLAISEDVRVYTIGIGTTGTAPYPAKDFLGRTVMQNIEVEIDEPLLKEIASKTNGQYFRAKNNRELQGIYEEIDQLERTKIELSSFDRKVEHFRPFAFLGLGIFLLSIVLNQFIFRPLN